MLWHGQCECSEHCESCGRNYFFTNQIQFLMSNFWTIWLVKCWLMLVRYTCNARVELESTQHHTDTRDAMLVLASYCEPAFTSTEHWTLFTSSCYMYFMSHIELLLNYVNYGTAGNFEIDANTLNVWTNKHTHIHEYILHCNIVDVHIYMQYGPLTMKTMNNEVYM